jgi:hypothetical protein
MSHYKFICITLSNTIKETKNNDTIILHLLHLRIKFEWHGAL